MADIFILAGESSGDQIGADLMARLNAKGGVRFSGVGGHLMQEQGLTTLFPMDDLSVMGVIDVLLHLPKLLFRLRQTGNQILRQKPDAVVLIDSQLFSTLLAERLRKVGFEGAILLYVAPTVWAYAPERAKKLAPLFDEVFAILPFEPELMAQLEGPPTRFVGHPAVAGATIRHEAPAEDWIGLMPGSRRGELRRHMPMFGEVVAKLKNSRPSLKFYLPTLPHIASDVTDLMRTWQTPAEITVDRQRRKELALQSQLALVSSGTATLEMALAGVPMVVTYVMDAHQRRDYRRFTIEHISLPNIILGRPLVPEMLFDKPDAGRLAASLLDLLDDAPSREAQLQGFADMEAYMQTGTPEHPRFDPADLVLAHLTARQSS